MSAATPSALSHAPQAFAWGDETPDDWKHVEGWHGSVMQSGGIRPPGGEDPARKFAEAVEACPRLADDLAHLMQALKPWLLQGAPTHYRDAGLSLFIEDNTGKMWIQMGAEPQNPYGDRSAIRVEWPDPMAETRAP